MTLSYSAPRLVFGARALQVLCNFCPLADCLVGAVSYDRVRLNLAASAFYHLGDHPIAVVAAEMGDMFLNAPCWYWS